MQFAFQALIIKMLLHFFLKYQLKKLTIEHINLKVLKNYQT